MVSKISAEMCTNDIHLYLHQIYSHLFTPAFE